MAKPALWAHNFVPSGELHGYLSGETLEACKTCKWPHDEHPGHPSRRPNWRLVTWPDGKESYWAGTRKGLEKSLKEFSAQMA